MKPNALTGLVLHDLTEYSPADRDAVARGFSLGAGIGVLGVVADSPASRAGLQADDEIIAIDSADVRDPQAASGGAPASFDREEAVLALLDRSAAADVVHLVVRRGEASIAVELRTESGCGGRFNLSPSRALNAWSDGTYVELTEAMLDLTANDDELAFVVAHEMAHNILNHQERLASAPGALLSGLGFGAGRVKATEVEADDYSVTLMSGAGYAAENALPFLERAGKWRWWDLAIDHPGIKRRMRTVLAALERLNASRPAVFAATTPAGPSADSLTRR